MIVFHTPGSCWFRGKTRRHTHMASTLIGAEGTAELLSFARQIGMEDRWLQDAGEPKEHFDIFDARIERARRAGALELSRREYMERTVFAKRAAGRDP